MILLIGFCLGLLGEAVVFMQRQLGSVESALLGDFKAIATPVSGRADPALESRLKMVPGVESVRRVTSDEAMARLKGEDPELAEALSAGPGLPDSYELKLSPETLPKISDWAAHARSAEPGLELNYQPAEASALVQVRFYRRFLTLAAVMAALGLAAAAGGRLELKRGLIRSLAGGAGGTALGASAALLLARQLGAASQLWAWPAWYAQVLLIGTGGIIASSARRS
jgi:hypothetical protein